MRTQYTELKRYTKQQINGLTKLLNSMRFARNAPTDYRHMIGLSCMGSISKEAYGSEYRMDIFHFETPKKITAEQTKLGKAWLKNYFYKLNGQPRKCADDVSERVLQISAKVSRFEFVGVLGFCNLMGEVIQYGPIYRTYDRSGNYFDYTPIHWGKPVIVEGY